MLTLDLSTRFVNTAQVMKTSGPSQTSMLHLMYGLLNTGYEAYGTPKGAFSYMRQLFDSKSDTGRSYGLIRLMKGTIPEEPNLKESDRADDILVEFSTGHDTTKDDIFSTPSTSLDDNDTPYLTVYTNEKPALRSGTVTWVWMLSVAPETKTVYHQIIGDVSTSCAQTAFKIANPVLTVGENVSAAGLKLGITQTIAYTNSPKKADDTFIVDPGPYPETK